MMIGLQVDRDGQLQDPVCSKFSFVAKPSVLPEHLALDVGTVLVLSGRWLVAV